MNNLIMINKLINNGDGDNTFSALIRSLTTKPGNVLNILQKLTNEPKRHSIISLYRF